jgi:uncharacterized small protein (DUF1192 family)
MTCTELQDLLYSIKIDELNPSERESFLKHLAGCQECAGEFQKISKADRVLSRLKDAPPRVQNEQALTESIISAIVSGKNSLPEIHAQTFLDRLIDIFNRKIIRFACAIVILLCGLTYVMMEYNDTQTIVSLEQRLGTKSQMNRAYIFQQEVTILNFMNDLYSLSKGTTSSVKLTNSLILMKKADLQTLLKGYETLDEASQKQLDELWNNYKEEEPSILSHQNNQEEIAALRNEIERLKKELDHYTHRKELP